MNKTIKSILISFLFPVILIIYIIISAFNIFNAPNSIKNPKELKYKKQTINIYISNSNDIVIKQEINVENCFKDYPSITYYSIPIPFYHFNSSELIDFSSNIDSNIIDKKFNKIILTIPDNNFYNSLKEKNYSLSFSYKISSDNLLYLNKKDSSILLKIDSNNILPNTNLYLHLPENTNISNNNILVSKINNNTYKINNIPFNIYNALNSGTNEDTFNIKIKNNLHCNISKYTSINFPLLLYIRITLILFSLFIAIIIIIARIKNIVFISKGIYERNTDSVIDSVSAEAIIDGKIDAKDLIMTCITNLIYKKNLELINETSIKLISADNITEIEAKILLLLLGDIQIGKIYNFSELKLLFKNNNEFTLDFNEKLLNIKKYIKENLIRNHIISKMWSTIINITKKASVFILVNTVLFFSDLISIYNSSLFIIFFEMILIIYLSSNSPKKIIRFQINRKNGEKMESAFLYTWSIIIIIISFKYYNFIQKLVFLIPIILNTFSIIFSNTFVLTHTGRIEYARALKLKRYIIDYSLIQERDLDGIVIWDDYLVYATAFGIPSKITNKIYESIMNINITLQLFDSLL